jgi:atlastin
LIPIEDIEPDFKTYVKSFIEKIFKPNLTTKQINGREITNIELFEYFKAYCKTFESDELPEPKSMLSATSEANNLAAKAIAKQFYLNAMDQVYFKFSYPFLFQI